MDYKEIDQKAIKLANDFNKLEAELLEAIVEVDKLRVYTRFGYNSTYQYIVQRLRLSESQAYAFITVARKSSEVPEIKKSISAGRLSVNKAKRITSVINKDNQERWLSLAESSSQRVIEREVAMSQPAKAIVEKVAYVPSRNIDSTQQTPPRVRMELGLSEKLMMKLRRAQDLVSQKQKQSASFEQTIEALVNDYIRRNDPVEKAKRQKIKGKLDVQVRKERVNKRKPLPAAIKHQVFLKAGGQCCFVDNKGKRCSSRRFLEIHHIKPLAMGGDDQLENLTLLCSGHHDYFHQSPGRGL